jgi:hypothetical protein
VETLDPSQLLQVPQLESVVAEEGELDDWTLEVVEGLVGGSLVLGLMLVDSFLVEGKLVDMWNTLVARAVGDSDAAVPGPPAERSVREHYSMHIGLP